MEDMVINVNTLPAQLNSIIRAKKVSIREENGVVVLTPITTENVKPIPKKKKKRKLGFLEGPPLPDSFFDPLPEEELQAWGL